ncbi:MAG: biotin--[acetyl-CoA-carboxylase] ligase [Sulfuricurvum sp. PD_MW2]|uniref:biotin--[acetyl-CoA-carboxylase] ligase n=1 Tax=Sulfuricurvum sp. PD_MW2 TaxID=2027917 RepID=UPI000C062027|nr:biotin--[acetyl-CoA-carboxylase] ligase [Sulfuricurvum sp. PD_MW2]PHM17835.1 MAG: biotin--[acetyl-CoA-carboxylase] ligase [Sulfuricurvum sp. PD_MW2]
MDIHWFESLDSTQRYLLDTLKEGTLFAPVCVGTDMQTKGRGSRGNQWIGEKGNLFISVAIDRSMLPKDLRLESSSIYFAFLMKELISSLDSKVWLKWPNDFYLEEKKIGGVITNLTGNILVCGIGINLNSAPDNFGKIDVAASPYELTKAYGDLFEKLPTWKQIFSKYKIEFENSRDFFTHNNNEKVALKNAVLLEDGSLECDGQRIFSLR